MSKIGTILGSFAAVATILGLGYIWGSRSCEIAMQEATRELRLQRDREQQLVKEIRGLKGELKSKKRRLPTIQKKKKRSKLVSQISLLQVKIDKRETDLKALREAIERAPAMVSIVVEVASSYERRRIAEEQRPVGKEGERVKKQKLARRTRTKDSRKSQRLGRLEGIASRCLREQASWEEAGMDYLGAIKAWDLLYKEFGSGDADRHIHRINREMIWRLIRLHDKGEEAKACVGLRKAERFNQAYGLPDGGKLELEQYLAICDRSK